MWAEAEADAPGENPLNVEEEEQHLRGRHTPQAPAHSIISLFEMDLGTQQHDVAEAERSRVPPAPAPPTPTPVVETPRSHRTHACGPSLHGTDGASAGLQSSRVTLEGNVSLGSSLQTNSSRPTLHTARHPSGLCVASHPDINSVPVKTLSTSTSTNMLISKTVSSSFAPVTPNKGKYEEVIKGVDEGPEDRNLEKSVTLQAPEEEHIYHFSKPEAIQQDVGLNAAEQSGRTSCQKLDTKKLDKMDNESMGKDFNKTSQQKPRRKKHRPKVIQEGSPVQTPKPLTPKPATPKPARNAKRKYARRNRKQNGSDTPTSLLGVDVNLQNASPPEKNSDPHSTYGSKSARRSLNFDSESQLLSVRSNVAPQVQGTMCSGTTASSSTKSTVQLAQGLEVVVENTSAGIAFDLNRSLNQVLDDYIKLPEHPAGSTQICRRKRKRENLKDLARKKGIMNNITEADKSLPSVYREEQVHVNLNDASDVVQEEENLEKNEAPRGHVDETSSHSLYFPRIHKKRRTEKGRSERIPDNQVTRSHSEVFTSMHEEGLMAIERSNAKHTYEFDRIEITTKKRSRVPIRARNPSSLAAIIACSPSTKKPCGYTNRQENRFYGFHACMEALYADICVKMKTKKRTKKRPIHLLSLIYSNTETEQEVASQSYRYFLGRKSILDHQSSSNFPGSFCASPFSGAVVPYVDPTDDIVQKLEYLSINRHQEDISFDKHALVPYVGGSMIVPYEGAFDITRKRRPRAKVDLDPETHKVWKLLMGKGALDAGDGSDMDKEKWWEDERAVFRGRIDSFIARMRLVQGDRRFSQWKGSVVDSVVGVFLTQNVSDHLSSSAFMALAARFPCQSRSENENFDSEEMSAKEHDHGCFQDFNHTIKSQEKMAGTEACNQGSIMDQRSQVIEGLDMTLSKELFDSNTEDGRTDYSKGKGADIHGRELRETQDSMIDAQKKVLGNTILQQSEERTLAEIVPSQRSTVSSENFSDYLSAAANQVVSSSDSNSDTEDLRDGSNCRGLNSTPYTKLLQIKENTEIFKSCSNKTGSLPKEKGGANDRQTCMNCSPSSEESTEAAGTLTLKSAHAVGSYASTSDHSLKQTNCLDKEVCIGKNSFCLTNLTREVIEALPVQDINLQLQESTKDTAEVQDQAQDCTRYESCSDSCNSLCKNSKIVKADKSNLNDEICSSQNDPTEMASRGKKSKAKSETKKTFDWDSLRKQACSIRAKKERSSDRMDSLDWEAIRCADVNELSQTIRERGMNNVLAERIKEFLDRLVRDHGSIDLEWLRDIPPEKAKDYLLSIRGLGLKSVECVRLLTLHHLAFPVDTNVGRICVRLGWVPLQPLPESLQLHLLELYPVLETIQKYLWPRLCTLDQRTLYELHYQMITFGKVFCTKSKPNCNACPMRGECRHFASAFASARLALPGPEEKSLVSSTIPSTSDNGHNVVFSLMPPPQLKGSEPSQERTIRDHDSVFKLMALPEVPGRELSMEGPISTDCEPIIEEPTTPQPECIEIEESAIEDAFYEDPDEIPTIELNLDELTQNLQNYMQTNNMELQEGDWSKALVALTPEAASIPMPKLKNVSRLRTEHQVYELPDSHPLLEGMDKREPDDPCPYLLAIWTPGETAQSTEPPKTCCDTRNTGKLCDKKVCFACNSMREAQAQTVRGTLLIPCRTAMRGSFPLNGTYFQVNEVFADHDSSCQPIDVPRGWIWNLPRRTVFFGTSIPTIFRGLTTEGIQQCFWRGFVCVRGFDKTTRAPKPLYARLHFPASKAPRNRRTAAKEESPMRRRRAKKA